MKTAKITVHKNTQGLWEVGTVTPLSDGEHLYLNRHEASTAHEAWKWIEDHYVD